MYMIGSKRKSHTSSETSTIVASSPTISETSTLVVPTPSPKKMRHRKYLTPPPRNPLPETYTPETPTIVLESPRLDDLTGYYAALGTPKHHDKRQHVYSPKSPKTKRRRTAGGTKRRRIKRKYTKTLI